ncbi:monovalent cation/H+ antiporter subunit A [Pararhodobacter oceanensis]|uniref:Monovalent cation/H+ antiporter subunit A n=1 Tax=Pararhodobacter oceanensis TaxID=2172121 RepID=A0A2T8HXY6_9RHOB|nr:monovalent cation/H+ antiporter subunit A [Pararhodobacter oceanensis]PVH30290.1 monovalent cation/H+ antiporter subunit A [Pararhodobacter oceanensis]
MSLALIAALPFLGALLPGLMIRSGRNACAMVTLSITGLALAGLLLNAPAVMAGETLTEHYAWLPALGLNVNFMLDGLGFLFALMILGIGLLIIIYARFYLSKDDPMGNFYTYLLLFQGAMVGIVLSDNILLLLVFWELTSLSSFLLIGYWKHLPEGRQGARMALAVTGMGGLAMIGGMLILGQIAGSYDISVILTQGEAIRAHDLYVPALVLILLGAFTKSAQFPFHFWLPHAMAAPTPVSAYLHSATMVKAGLFLMARLWPVLSGTPEWFWLVAGAGLITMVLGAVIALFKDDLKALLAFSTVSHLGLITMLLGMGTEYAAKAAVFHIINHATFKAALFMIAGIVDHEAGTRNIRLLGGLRKLMPVTFTIGTIGALSMAGIPFFNGFLSKEMMLEAAWDTSTLFAVVATLGAVFSVAYSFRFVVHTFMGPVRNDYPMKPHDPGFGMWAAPAFLAVLVVLIGLFPQQMVGPFVEVVAGAVTGGHPHVHLALWHGLTPALYMSAIAVAGGLVFLALQRSLAPLWDNAPRPEAKAIFDAIVEAAARAANRITDSLHDGKISRYLAVFTVVVVAYGAWAFTGGTHSAGTRELLPITLVELIFFVLLVVACIGLILVHRKRFVSLIVISIVGLVVSMSFVQFSAADLALTQLTVEVVTVILLLLALNYMPKETPIESGGLARLRDGVIALAAGGGVAALAYAILTRDMSLPSISEYHVANSYIGGGGNNVVNVILVDFRGFDTMGEIIVLGIAALVIYALVEVILNGAASRRLMNWVPDMPQAYDRHPLMMVVATRVALPIALTVGVYIFLRGHNLPGGGFIAGLVVAIALLTQYMASGFAWTQARQRFDYHEIIASGIMIAVMTGVASLVLGWNFLSSTGTYITIWPLEEIHLTSAVAFDLGVFLTVVGAVLLALASLSRIGRRAGQGVNLTAMDVDPSAETLNTEGER